MASPEQIEFIRSWVTDAQAGNRDSAAMVCYDGLLSATREAFEEYDELIQIMGDKQAGTRRYLQALFATDRVDRKVATLVACFSQIPGFPGIQEETENGND